MALVWTSIDNQASSSGATRTNSVPVGGVPLGALLVGLVMESSNALPNGGSMADAGGNTYTYRTGANANNIQANGFCAIFTAPVATALTSTQLITYTKAVSGGNTRLITGYVTGQDTTTPVDTTATTSNFGSSSTASVTSGTPAQSAPLYVGVAIGTGGGTPTQPGGWTSISANSTAPTSASANILGTGTTPQTYNPVWTGSRVWSAAILVVNPPIGGGGAVPVKLLSLMGVG